MKGVIKRELDAELVDITHTLPRQDIRSAAFWLREILPWFPPATHLVVIDPGVGTDRAGLVIVAGDHALVGPDNGVLAPVTDRLSETTAPVIYRIDETAFSDRSQTFHGRDVFAPVAAAVARRGQNAIDTIDYLTPMTSWTHLTFPEPSIDEDTAVGSVLAIDDFGNVITNIPGSFLANRVGDHISVNGDSVPAAMTYAAQSPGTPLVTIGSHGNVELAVNQGRGDVQFDLTLDDVVRLADLDTSHQS